MKALSSRYCLKNSIGSWKFNRLKEVAKRGKRCVAMFSFVYIFIVI